MAKSKKIFAYAKIGRNEKRNAKNMAKKNRHKRGPKANHLKLKGDWQSAVNKALKQVKPSGGWPKKGKNTHESD